MSRVHRKFSMMFAVAMAAASALYAQQSQPTSGAQDPELAALMQSYEARVVKDVETPLVKAQQDLSKNYINALERAQQEATLKSRLEEAQALRQEKDSVAASDAKDLPWMPEGLRQLPTLRQKYLAAVKALRTTRVSMIKPMQEELVRQLEALAVRMVRAGKGDVALEARQLAKRHAESTPVWAGDWEEQVLKVTPKPKDTPVVLKKGNSIATERSFTPPLDIEVVAKVENRDMRLGYAADQVIFNWESRPNELRIDGGPADKSYLPTQGEIPADKYVVIRWTVTKTQQKISVDGKLRFEHQGDYSAIDRPISIKAFGSTVTVKSIKTRPVEGAN